MSPPDGFTLSPDTIADFRCANRKAFRSVFRQFVLLCRQLDLFGRELLAVDGTRIKAVNNKDRNFTRASLTQFIKLADAKLEEYLGPPRYGFEQQLGHLVTGEIGALDNLETNIAKHAGHRLGINRRIWKLGDIFIRAIADDKGDATVGLGGACGEHKTNQRKKNQ